LSEIEILQFMKALRYLRHWGFKFWSYIIKACSGPEWVLPGFRTHNFQCICCLLLKVCIKNCTQQYNILFSIGLLFVHLFPAHSTTLVTAHGYRAWSRKWTGA